MWFELRRENGSAFDEYIYPCKTKSQCLLTLQVSGYCLLTSQNSVIVNDKDVVIDGAQQTKPENHFRPERCHKQDKWWNFTCFLTLQLLITILGVIMVIDTWLHFSTERWACFLDHLTAGVAYIGFFTQLLPHSVPPFKHVKAIMWHQSARFEKSLPPFCQIWIIFSHLKLWIASARHNFKWVKIPIK